MASTLNSNRQEVKQQNRNWLDLPSDVMADILKRIGVVDILENAQKVCTHWYKLCKDPAMWRVIHMESISDQDSWRKMCKHAVDRSQGQLVDFSIVGCGYHEQSLLNYVADRSSELRRLEIVSCWDYPVCYGWKRNKPPIETLTGEALEKFPLLEELSIYCTYISKETFETAGRCCPMLKTLKLIQEVHHHIDYMNLSLTIRNEIAVAIGENCGELRHLELVSDTMTNIGLEVILDGCRYLESLDLRDCVYIDLKGAVGKRCSQHINCLKLPKDSLNGCPYIYRNYFLEHKSGG